MIDINEMRRLAQAATPGPWKMVPVGDGRQKFAVADSEYLSILTVTDEGEATFGTVYDDADAKFIAAANPAALTELLDRLEEAESDALEQARLNGMGSEREAALMAKLEAAEKERDALRTRIAEMEGQEPVKHEFQGRDGVWYPFINQRHHENTVADGSWPVRALYALPGAQPAPSFADAYQGAMEEVAIWKKRALEAEELNRKFIAEINGPTYMGEPAQPAPNVPSNEYVGWYCAHCERGVDASEVTYHEQHQACGRVITDDRPPKASMSVPEGWKLVPIDPTLNMCIQGDNARENIDDGTRTPAIYRAMLAAAPEAKP